MIFGKYGKMILANMERNYPYKNQDIWKRKVYFRIKKASRTTNKRKIQSS